MKIVLDSNDPRDLQYIRDIISPSVTELVPASGESVEAITAAPEPVPSPVPTPTPPPAEAPAASAFKADPEGWIKKDPNPANFKKVDPATKKATVLKMGFTPGTTVAMIAAQLECTEGNVLNHMSQLYNKHGFGYMRNTKTGEIKFLAPPKEQIQAAAVQPTVSPAPVVETSAAAPAAPAPAAPAPAPAAPAPAPAAPAPAPAAPAPELPAEMSDLLGDTTPATTAPAATPGVEINDFDELFSGSDDATGVTDFLQ